MLSGAVAWAEDTRAPTAKNVQLLFAIKAADAELKQIKGNQFQLTVQRSSIVDGILAFSDRPNRISFRMSLDNYLKLNHKGPNSFAKNPPNVSLSWSDNTPAMPYVMTGGSLIGNNVSWNLQALSDPKQPSLRKGLLTVFLSEQDD